MKTVNDACSLCPIHHGCTNQNLLHLNLNISRTKKWQKQAAISTRIKNYRTYWLLSFYPDKYAYMQIYLQKVAIFNIYNVFAPFVKLCGYRLLHFLSLCDVRNKVAFLIQYYSNIRALNGKNHEKNIPHKKINHV